MGGGISPTSLWVQEGSTPESHPYDQASEYISDGEMEGQGAQLPDRCNRHYEQEAGGERCCHEARILQDTQDNHGMSNWNIDQTEFEGITKPTVRSASGNGSARTLVSMSSDVPDSSME